MHLLFVSGLSGSGKSVALQMLEDLQYYCVDNIPAALLHEFVSYAMQADDPAFEKTAIGIDARNRRSDIESVPALAAPVDALLAGEPDAGSPAMIASACELVLEGLHLAKRLNKDASGGRAQFRARA